MDSNSNEDIIEEQIPECKVCYTTENLMGVPVCECRGSMGNICCDCLRTILNNQRRIVPLCPDCSRPYRNYRVVRAQHISYNDYMTQNNGLTYTTISYMSFGGVCYLTLVNLWYWLSSFSEEWQPLFTTIYLVLMFIFVMSGTRLGVSIFEDITRYRNRGHVGRVFPVLTNEDNTVLPIDDSNMTDTQQAFGANIEGFDDIPYIDEEEDVLPDIEQGQVAVHMELNNKMNAFAYPEDYPLDYEDPYVMFHIAKGPLSFEGQYIPYIDEEEEEEPKYQDSYL